MKKEMLDSKREAVVNAEPEPEPETVPEPVTGTRQHPSQYEKLSGHFNLEGVLAND